MKHIMLDAYGAKTKNLNDVKYVNNSLAKIAVALGGKTVAPPFLLPYYYGVEPEDIGISAFLFLKGGHLTIHTFPLRECYFVDMMMPEAFDTEKAKKLFNKYFAFTEDMSLYQVAERDISMDEVQPIDGEEVFGPHIMAKIKAKVAPNMEEIFNFLEGIISSVNMTPIIRPYVIKDSMKNPKYLSGIVMIAESHISFHYDMEDKLIYFDLFSCKMFDTSPLKGLLTDKYGTLESYFVTARGTKHKYLKANRHNKKTASNLVKKSSSAWVNNIIK